MKSPIQTPISTPIECFGSRSRKTCRSNPYNLLRRRDGRIPLGQRSNQAALKNNANHLGGSLTAQFLE